MWRIVYSLLLVSVVITVTISLLSVHTNYWRKSSSFDESFFDLDSGEDGNGSVVLDINTIASILKGEVIRTDSDAWHDMNDEQLFKKAAQVSREGSDGRPRKVAFLFLTRGRLPLAPFWWKFLKGYKKWYSIYIHTLPGFQYTKKLPKPFRRRQIPSQVVGWGKMSMIDAERRLLANAMLDPLNDRFVLVSESCIPIFNFTFVYNYLMNSDLSFLASVDKLGMTGQGRYSQDLLPEVALHQWRKGSQWFELTREGAAFAISDTLYYEKFKAFCTGACYNDEHYYPTVFHIVQPDKIANRTVMHVTWRRGKHPMSYGKADVNKELIQSMKDVKNCTWNDEKEAHCYLFARKFRAGSIVPLLELAEWMGM